MNQVVKPVCIDEVVRWVHGYSEYSPYKCEDICTACRFNPTLAKAIGGFFRDLKQGMWITRHLGIDYGRMYSHLVRRVSSALGWVDVAETLRRRGKGDTARIDSLCAAVWDYLWLRLLALERFLESLYSTFEWHFPTEGEILSIFPDIDDSQPDSENGKHPSYRDEALRLWNCNPAYTWDEVAVLTGQIPSPAFTSEIKRYAQNTGQRIRRAKPGRRGKKQSN